MNLEIISSKYNLIYDNFDTNAVIFEFDNGYFTIQVGVYLDKNEELNEPYFEFNDQGDSQNGGLEAVFFHEHCIIISFKDLFLQKYKNIKIVMKEKINKDAAYFFVNCLFLGDFVFYDANFDQSNKVFQTEKREYLQDY